MLRNSLYATMDTGGCRGVPTHPEALMRLVQVPTPSPSQILSDYLVEKGLEDQQRKHKREKNQRRQLRKWKREMKMEEERGSLWDEMVRLRGQVAFEERLERDRLQRGCVYRCPYLVRVVTITDRKSGW